MNAKTIVRVLFIVLAALALTALVAGAQDAPSAPEKALPAVIEKGESASPAANLTESEPNNSFGTADLMGLYDIMAGKIGVAGDSDYYHIYDDYRPGYAALIDIDAQRNGSPLDAYICVYDQDFVELACNDDSDGLDSMLYVYIEDPEDDWEIHLYVRVQELNHGNEGGNDYTYTLSVFNPYFVSPVANGTVSGVAFQKGDILARTGYGASTKWILFFDASDVGVTQNTNSIDVSFDGAALTFQGNQAIPGLGTVTPYDVVWFNANQWGPSTWGWFSSTLLLDGSTVGLSAASEKIDAIAEAHNTSGHVVISTTGAAAVPATGGGTLKARDEDVISYWPSSRTWELEFDGSAVSGLGMEDITAANWDGDSVDDWLDFVIQGNGVINGYAVNQKDIVQCYDFWPAWTEPWLELPFTIDAISNQ